MAQHGASERLSRAKANDGRVAPVTAGFIVGAGLIALDVVVSAAEPHSIRQWAGGTCGNVLLALRYLGWRSTPLARFGKGEATGHVLKDLRAWGVSTAFIAMDEGGSTPVIVHRIGRTVSGEPYHSFSWRCPNCGNWLPGYKPVLLSNVLDLVTQLQPPTVFFFDRVSAGTLALARAFSERGAAIVFEPTGLGNPILFREAWRLAHIVKYSHERLRDLPSDFESDATRHLQIETLGREGLRYRSRLPKCAVKTWQRLDAVPADNVKDAAGAGDWCTAGILDKLLRHGLSDLKAATDARVREAMRYGQALAVWNCSFEGARGGMYSVDRRAFRKQIARILAGNDRREASNRSHKRSSLSIFDSLCPSCVESEGHIRRQLRKRSRVNARK